jgi:hypothetical protein
MKKNNSTTSVEESVELDKESYEEESVSTSESIIEKLKNALKKKKGLKRKQSNRGPANNMKINKKTKNEDVTCTKGVEQEEEGDVENEEDEQ